MTGHLLAQHIIRGLHLLGIVALVGGLAYRYLVARDTWDELTEETTRRWAIMVHSTVGVVFLTGLANTMFAMKAHKGQPLYHSLYGLKFLLALAALALVSISVGKRSSAKKMRKRERFWLGILLALVVAVFLLALVMRAIPIKT